MPDDLPFTIEAHLLDKRSTCQFVAVVNGNDVDMGMYVPGQIDRRKQLASQWAENSALWNGQAPNVKDICQALAHSEATARADIEAALDSSADEEDADGTPVVVAVSYVDDRVIAELAWNFKKGGPDFILYDREACEVSRVKSVELDHARLVPPKFSKGIVTPGGHLPGSVQLASEYDETGLDEDRLRMDVRDFIYLYVELPGDALELVVEYVLLTWVFDAFDEVPYLAFRTADAGRGKSRALETVGALCYRPILCGGGSTAAATLRLLHYFGGTLIADEFDQRDTELASELTKIINQGFQRNRPLVRCDGESNTPTAFRCFGPKLFALRKGFADDATESRIISIRMQQRTRSEVPISLPRQRFDEEALRLRNRLLAWRFANMGKIKIDPGHADPDLEDRLNQIGLPLLAVARSHEGRAVVVEALRQQQGNIAADRAASLPGEVFEAVLRIAEPGNVVLPGDVAREVNKNRAEIEEIDVDKLKKPITSHLVGRILRKVLELPCEKRQQRGIPYRLNPRRMGQLNQRFGVPLPASTPSTEVHPTATTAESAP